MRRKEIMFCQFCGTEATHELNYCKRCGGNLNPPTGISVQDARPPVSPWVAGAIGLTTLATVLGGLAIILVGLHELARAGLPPELLGWLAMFGAATLFGSLALFIWLWARVLGVGGVRASRAPKDTPRLKKASFTGELSGAKAMSLPDPVPASVTEHTTRTFDAVYSEPRRRE
jgi:hypothetical protein